MLYLGPLLIELSESVLMPELTSGTESWVSEFSAGLTDIVNKAHFLFLKEKYYPQ